VLTAPAGAATGLALQPTFTWAASIGAVTSTLEVASDPGFSAIVTTQAGLVTTSFTPGVPLTGGTNCYWRVTAVNGSGTTVATGAPFRFTTRSSESGGNGGNGGNGFTGSSGTCGLLRRRRPRA